MPRSHSRGILYTAPPSEGDRRDEQTDGPTAETDDHGVDADAPEPTPADD